MLSFVCGFYNGGNFSCYDVGLLVKIEFLDVLHHLISIWQTVPTIQKFTKGIVADEVLGIKEIGGRGGFRIP